MDIRARLTSRFRGDADAHRNDGPDRIGASAGGDPGRGHARGPLPAAPTPSGAPSYQPGLTDEEWAPFATTWGIRHTTVDSPTVSAARAEAIVRERYPGDRPLVWSGPVTYGDAPRVGWMVVLGIATGQACALHPGLLDRALEGGIVDAVTGEIFFTMTCG